MSAVALINMFSLVSLSFMIPLASSSVTTLRIMEAPMTMENTCRLENCVVADNAAAALKLVKAAGYMKTGIVRDTIYI